MANKPRFLILDGYAKEYRDQFDEVGMKQAWILYRDMLLKYLPEAEYDVWLSSDDTKGGPTDAELPNYAAILWPGCNLTCYHDNERVTWTGTHRAPINDRGVYPRPYQDKLPIWIAIGGTPQSGEADTAAVPSIVMPRLEMPASTPAAAAGAPQ